MKIINDTHNVERNGYCLGECAICDGLMTESAIRAQKNALRRMARMMGQTQKNISNI